MYTVEGNAFEISMRRISPLIGTIESTHCLCVITAKLTVEMIWIGWDKQFCEGRLTIGIKFAPGNFYLRI